MQYTLTSVVLSSVGVVSTVCLGKWQDFKVRKTVDWVLSHRRLVIHSVVPKHSCVTFAMANKPQSLPPDCC